MTSHVQNPQQTTTNTAAPAPRLTSPWGWPESADKALARHSSAGKEYEFFGDAYSIGCAEGEFAFSLAATASTPGDAIWRAKEMLLARLGLVADDPKTANTRGWIIGLFESLSDAVDQLTLTAPAADCSTLLTASRDLARHFSTGELGIGPESSIEACRAVDLFMAALAVEGGA